MFCGSNLKRNLIDLSIASYPVAQSPFKIKRINRLTYTECGNNVQKPKRWAWAAMKID